MSDETDDGDQVEGVLAPDVRARLYRRRARDLLADAAASALPLHTERLELAAQRFLALAEAQERVSANRSGRTVDPAQRQAAVILAMGPLVAFLRGDPGASGNGSLD